MAENEKLIEQRCCELLKARGSVTGVAGPERDERGNAVGTVFIGFSTPEETVAERFDFGEKSRAEIRALSAEEALKLLEEKMKEV